MIDVASPEPTSTMDSVCPASPGSASVAPDVPVVTPGASCAASSHARRYQGEGEQECCRSGSSHRGGQSFGSASGSIRACQVSSLQLRLDRLTLLTHSSSYGSDDG